MSLAQPNAGRRGGLRIARALRDSDWLGLDRVRIYSALLLGFSVLFALWWVAMAKGPMAPNGLPLGSDFVSFKAAANLAFAGHAADAYAPTLHHAAERAAVGDADFPYFAFFYPPVYLLACLPLAVVPYLGALALWFCATGGAFLAVMRRILPHRQALLPILAFPSVLIEFTHGQNGFLTAALLGSAILCLQRRPLRSGLLFGCLCYKPQFAVLLPLALMLSGRWRVVAGATASVVLLCAVSVLAFGYASWQGFWVDGALAREALEQGLVGFGKMQSVFAAIRLLGGSIGAAYLGQTLVTLAVAITVLQVWRSGASLGLQGATLAIGCVLATPFVFDYDFTLLALALAWTVREGQEHGFRPYEKLVGLAIFLLPLIDRQVAIDLGVPLSPPLVGVFFFLVTRRALGRAASSEVALANASFAYHRPPAAGVTG